MVIVRLVGGLGIMCATVLGVTILQELVVALVARLLGDRVPVITTAYGRIVAQRQLGSVLVRVSRVPILAVSVMVTSRAEGQRRRIVLARLAGFVMVLAPLVLLYVYEPQGHAKLTETLVPDLTAPFTVAAIVSAVLLVMQPRTQLRQALNYGIALEADHHVRNGAYARAVAVARRGVERDRDDVTLQLALAGALSHTADTDEAFTLADQLRRREGLPETVAASVLNLWAWLCVLRGADEHVDEADRVSEKALASHDRGELHDTRGHVLLWRKRYAEAEPHFLASYAAQKRSPFGRMSSAAGMAMLCAATDRPDEARTWLERARAERIEHDLVARATAAVEPLSRR